MFGRALSNYVRVLSSKNLFMGSACCFAVFVAGSVYIAPFGRVSVLTGSACLGLLAWASKASQKKVSPTRQ